MAAPWNPPTKNEDFEIGVSLPDMSNPGSYKANPTLAAGDVKITKDGGALANVATLPTVTPAGGIRVRLQLSATEMNADQVFVQFIDQTSPKEWGDVTLIINTTG